MCTLLCCWLNIVEFLYISTACPWHACLKRSESVQTMARFFSILISSFCSTAGAPDVLHLILPVFNCLDNKEQNLKSPSSQPGHDIENTKGSGTPVRPTVVSIPTGGNSAKLDLFPDCRHAAWAVYRLPIAYAVTIALCHTSACGVHSLPLELHLNEPPFAGSLPSTHALSDQQAR